MIRKSMNRKIIAFALGIAALISFPYISKAVDSEPGSEEDPIVTQGYVEMRNNQLKYYIDESIKKINDSIVEINNQIQKISKDMGNSSNNNKDINISSSISSTYEIVTVPANKKIILGASTELILRAGQATVIDSQYGGLADVTMGKDLKYGERVPSNHLLIVPRDDGRGAEAKTDAIFMVKGSYYIIE
ncbi:hypothetical protein SAMN02745883_01488 [Caminicella sporogenes DSM 14501]|uniref:Uncharacterized protein n=1 Tax=Caminicella sporogenes DSM 14501 TaxID=1121266 RepID=A0A1M6QGN5_9FIRM|nr:hypothetical protein [Caminicella sporogenes]RKD25324.1 hypothetical protein BET04_03685 [Caminicella sporogenes]SHK19233.1 hypothetical protein SAMN02745883_01488 [Caminicella sporogenes DSM 14501]